MYALHIVKKVLLWTHINLSEFLAGKDRIIILPDFHEIQFSPLKTKHRLFYLKTQSVPRSKHFPSRL
jgi:hypothetical protein